MLSNDARSELLSIISSLISGLPGSNTPGPRISGSSSDPSTSKEKSDPPEFPGIRATSQKGKPTVLVYNIPKSGYCYSFNFNTLSSSTGLAAYNCVACKSKSMEEKRKAKKNNEVFTGIGYHVTVKVVGDHFLSDPVLLPHKCEPQKKVRVDVNRRVYKHLQQIREDPDCVLKKPKLHWKESLNEINEDKSLKEKEKEQLKEEFCGGRVYKRRLAYSRALSKGKKRKATIIEEIPKMEGSSEMAEKIQVHN